MSIRGDGRRFQGRPEKSFRGKRIAWAGDFKGYLPFEPGVLGVCKGALKTFESMGCTVEEAQPDYSIEAVWRAWLKLRAWQQGGGLLAYYNDPTKRALMKPEAVFEVESGLKLTAFDITAASVVPLALERGEGCTDLRAVAGIKNLNLQGHGARCRFHSLQRWLCNWLVGGVDKHRHTGSCG